MQRCGKNIHFKWKLFCCQAQKKHLFLLMNTSSVQVNHHLQVKISNFLKQVVTRFLTIPIKKLVQLDHVKLLRSAYYYTFQYAVTRIAQRFPVPDTSILNHGFWDCSCSGIELGSESRDCDWMNLIAILLVGNYSRNRFLFRDYSLVSVEVFWFSSWGIWHSF